MLFNLENCKDLEDKVENLLYNINWFVVFFGLLM